MMVLTQDGPCDFSTHEHQNAELQNVSEGPPPPASEYKRIQAAPMNPRGNLSSSSVPFFSNT